MNESGLMQCIGRGDVYTVTQHDTIVASHGDALPHKRSQGRNTSRALEASAWEAISIVNPKNL